MPHLHFDPVSGASGDMILAALIDLGVDVDALAKELRKIGLGDITLHAAPVRRNGIAAVQIAWKTSAASPHPHTPGPARRLSDMLALATNAPYAPTVRDKAVQAFRLLAEAEAKVHGVSPEEVHFHEISGIDTIVDVFGVFLVLEILGVTSITSSPPAVGRGTVTCEHGVFPVPAPATMEILRQRAMPFCWGPVDAELLTPTGAALLACCVERFAAPSPFQAHRIGYGAGSHENAGLPNVLRAICGTPAALDQEIIVEFRMALDDMTPAAIADLLNRTRAAGALDSYALPANMKKDRPGVEVVILAPPAKADDVERLLFIHSSTFGLRRQWLPRRILQRESIPVSVHGQEVRIKVGYYEGKVIRLQPEYEDCRAASLATGLPLAEISRLAMNAGHDKLQASGALASAPIH